MHTDTRSRHESEDSIDGSLHPQISLGDSDTSTTNTNNTYSKSKGNDQNNSSSSSSGRSHNRDQGLVSLDVSSHGDSESEDGTMVDRRKKRLRLAILGVIILIVLVAMVEVIIIIVGLRTTKAVNTSDFENSTATNSINTTITNETNLVSTTDNSTISNTGNYQSHNIFQGVSDSNISFPSPNTSNISVSDSITNTPGASNLVAPTILMVPPPRNSPTSNVVGEVTPKPTTPNALGVITPKPTPQSISIPTAQMLKPPTRQPTPQPTPQPTDGWIQAHSVHTELLDLQDWEQKSLQGLLDFAAKKDATSTTEQTSLADFQDTCQPPDGVSSVCCLGGASTGGDMSINNRHMCSQSMLNGTAMEAMRQDVQEFFQQNPNDPKQSPWKCDVCWIVELARRRKLRIAFVGDSTQAQTTDGLACELERRGYIVEQEIMHVNQDHDGSWTPRRHLRTRKLHIRSPFWDDDDDAVTIHYYQMYLLPAIEPTEMTEIIANTDVLVLGFGLHWWYTNDTPHTFRRAESYVVAMKTFFRRVALQGDLQLLVHRESTAEHYDSPGGDGYVWSQNNDASKSHQCQPIDSSDTVAYWRERSVAKAAQQAGFDLITAGPDMPPYNETGNNEVVALPYYYFTEKQYSMHPYQRDFVQDCTHYCSSPFLYMPLWRSLRFAMDRQFWNSNQ